MKTNAALDLPDECWELIFNRVVGGGHYYHLDSISLVCKRFLSISNFVRRTLTISDPRILLHCNLSKLFRRFNHINCICIQNCRQFHQEDLDRVIGKIARSGLNVEELNLSSPEWILNHQLTEMISEVSLRELGSNMKNLKILKFKYCSLKDNDLIAIANSLPRLQELDITALPSTRKQFVTDEKMLELTSKLKELRKINISGYSFSSQKSILALSSNCALLSEVALAELDFEGGNASSYALQYFSNLTSLSVTHLGVFYPSLAFKNSISHARALHALAFEYLDLSDGLLLSIAEARLPLKKLKFIQCRGFTFSGLSLLLHEYQSLNELSLVSTDFLTDQHMKHLSKYLSNLTHIDLSRCDDLTSSTLFTLARSCPSLVYIIMSVTNDLRLFGRKGEEGEIPADYLEKNNQIQRLELCNKDSLNDKSLKKIGHVCPNLQMLDLSGCRKITDKGIGEILKSCPNIRHLKVNWCRGLKMIVGTESEESKLSIEVLEAKAVGINKKGMTMIGMRCPGLLKLNLIWCQVKEEELMEVVEKCSNLMEIQLTYCSGCSTDVLYRMLLKRPSLRKIIISRDCGLLTEDETRDCGLLTEDEINLFFRHGCRVYTQNLEDLYRTDN